MTEGIELQGTCREDFDPVRKALEANFADGDVGASCAVSVGGEIVVDLWGGHADLGRQHRWQADTIVNVWSTTKMMTALCVLMLHDRGDLSLDEPVATYWPEFAANGKEAVLVRHVMGHTAGLPAFDDLVDDVDLFDWHACCARLAAQAPRWTPGDGSGYHAETQGWLNGEIVRRVTGTTVGEFFRTEVAEPLGADFHFAVGDGDLARVADTSTFQADMASEHSRRSAGLVNTIGWRQLEMPASGGHGNARSIVQSLSPLANGGGGLVSPNTIERIFEVQAEGVDRMLGRELKLGIGYGLNHPAAPLGVNDRTIWWAGWGGSMCVVDLENQMVVAYAMNQMRGDDDLRSIRCVFAAHEAVAA